VHVVADTNTVVSGLLWYGNPRQALDAAPTGAITLSTSASLLAELAEVLQRPKFAQRLARANLTPHTLVFGYAVLARLVVPAPIAPVVEADPDDDAVLTCAVAAQAEVIVSGDSDLLALESYETTPIQGSHSGQNTTRQHILIIVRVALKCLHTTARINQ
jgi:putative PIN family toxin of toxin-antitoxin system